MKILLMHAYSASNAGDGLLVRESLDLLREAFGPDVQATILALHPSTFADIDAAVLDARPRPTGWPREYRAALRGIADYDMVVGVGGGYLRAGKWSESFKTIFAHGPQLAALKRTNAPIVYLPQSIGPLRRDLAGLLRRWLRNADVIYLRDDKSMAEVHHRNTRRVPDVALLADRWEVRRNSHPHSRPVLSTRYVHGRLPRGIKELVRGLGEFDGYVQSTGGGNDDRAAVAETRPFSILEREQFLDSSVRRVVVAVRLHAALMALRAGHWVIHLAYERKGFGAFQDLGLTEFVYNVNDFDPAKVLEQVNELRASAHLRSQYDSQVNDSIAKAQRTRKVIVDDIRKAISHTSRVVS